MKHKTLKLETFILLMIVLTATCYAISFKDFKLTGAGNSMYPTINDSNTIRVYITKDVRLNDIVMYSPLIFKMELPDGTIKMNYIVHRIVQVRVIDGKTYFITKGDNNPYPDENMITKDNIYGKVIKIF